jgi:hypothetical protein
MRPKSTTTASRRRLISLAVGVIFLFATAACDNNGDGLPKGDQAPPPQVTVMTVTPKTFQLRLKPLDRPKGRAKSRCELSGIDTEGTKITKRKEGPSARYLVFEIFTFKGPRDSK